MPDSPKRMQWAGVVSKPGGPGGRGGRASRRSFLSPQASGRGRCSCVRPEADTVWGTLFKKKNIFFNILLWQFFDCWDPYQRLGRGLWKWNFFSFSVNPLQASGFMAALPVKFWKVNLVDERKPRLCWRTFVIISNWDPWWLGFTQWINLKMACAGILYFSRCFHLTLRIHCEGERAGVISHLHSTEIHWLLTWLYCYHADACDRATSKAQPCPPGATGRGWPTSPVSPRWSPAQVPTKFPRWNMFRLFCQSPNFEARKAEAQTGWTNWQSQKAARSRRGGKLTQINCMSTMCCDLTISHLQCHLI